VRIINRSRPAMNERAQRWRGMSRLV